MNTMEKERTSSEAERAEAIERVKDWSEGRTGSRLNLADLKAALDELETLKSWQEDDTVTNRRLRSRITDLETELREMQMAVFELRGRIQGALRG